MASTIVYDDVIGVVPDEDRVASVVMVAPPGHSGTPSTSPHVHVPSVIPARRPHIPCTAHPQALRRRGQAADVNNEDNAQAATTHPMLSFLLAILAIILSILRTLISSAWLVILSTIVLIYRYILLLGLFHLDSVSRPLTSLNALAMAVSAEGFDTQTAAEADLHAAWHAYRKSLGRDLDMTSGSCAVVLTLTIGLLAITSVAEEVVTKTIAFACMFAGAAGIVMSLNMRRHLSNIGLLHAACYDWIKLAKRSETARFTAVSMLLAGPSAWTAWSVVSFIAILLSYVWRFHDSMAQVNTASGNSSLHGMLLTLVHNATKPQATDLSSSPNGIVVLPWASRITLGVVFVVAAAHFVLNALFFTKLGLPVIGEDVPLDEVRVKADDFSSAATPDPSNVAIPGFFQAIPMHEAQIPAAIAGEGSLHTAEPYPSGHVPEVVPGGGRVELPSA